VSEGKQNFQRQADRARAGSKRSVMTYMTIMFVAAFVLLLLAYFMQHRSNEEAIDGLKNSVTAMQTAQQVYEENSVLKEQVNQLEDQIQAMENQIAGLERSTALLQGERDSLLYTHESTIQAMDWFWQINEAYVRGRTTLARELIESINQAGLTQYLPTESITDNGRFSPYERYLEIYDALY